MDICVLADTAEDVVDEPALATVLRVFPARLAAAVVVDTEGVVLVGVGVELDVGVVEVVVVGGIAVAVVDETVLVGTAELVVVSESPPQYQLPFKVPWDKGANSSKREELISIWPVWQVPHWQRVK